MRAMNLAIVEGVGLEVMEIEKIKAFQCSAVLVSYLQSRRDRSSTRLVRCLSLSLR